jgi:hypothetical protein
MTAISDDIERRFLDEYLPKPEPGQPPIKWALPLFTVPQRDDATDPATKHLADRLMSRVIASAIDARERPPEPGLIVKGWNTGAVWAGRFDGSPKAASCDWWIPLALDAHSGPYTPTPRP